jgi:hypothetical protein
VQNFFLQPGSRLTVVMIQGIKKRPGWPLISWVGCRHIPALRVLRKDTDTRYDQFEKEDKIRGLKKGCPYQNRLWFFFPKICFSASETFCTAYSLVLGMNR